MPPADDSLRNFYATKRARELLAHLDVARVPRHIAIIMDGNGRWAARRGLPRIAGHRAGAKAVRESIASCIELGVDCLTIYSFSSENWRRPADEVSGLMDLFVEVLERELDNLERMGVRVRVIGHTEDLPPATRDAFARCEVRTATFDRLTLLVALNYGGRTEIIDAVRSIAADAASGSIDPSAIAERDISERLYTAGEPDPDLVIRTSGEMRVSNFLLWQIAYSELWVTSVLWPDFGRIDLLRAVVDYQKRSRRFGGRV
ncbi:MAG: isoprenyl transferase [Actinomycetota bacterium]|nr:isoprenyl transferase [Actinomycetota bacterium]